MENFDLITKKFQDLKQTMPTFVDEAGWIVDEKANDEFTARFYSHRGVLFVYIWFNSDMDTNIFEDILNHAYVKEGCFWRSGNIVVSKNIKEGDCFVIKFDELKYIGKEIKFSEEIVMN